MCTRFAGKGVPVEPIIGAETYGVLTWQGEMIGRAISRIFDNVAQQMANFINLSISVCIFIDLVFCVVRALG